MMFLEVIAQNSHDVMLAQQAGAKRIELVSEMKEDGLSPDFDTIESVLAIATIPIRVMVRFHNRNFIYTNEETNAMCNWIKQLKTLPIDGFVLGGLTSNNQIDHLFLQRMCDAVEDKNITFHRAFDRLNDPISASDEIAKYKQIDTILTSGGLMQPINANLSQLVALQRRHPNTVILAGGGVNESTISHFAHSEITHFHVGSCVRHNNCFENEIDPKRIQHLFSVYKQATF